VWGQSVTFTATVVPVAPGAGTPTGTVTFSDGNTVLGTGTLTTSAGVTSATFNDSSLSVGTHSVTASYGGNTNFTSSTSSPFSQTVKAGTTLSLGSSANPSVWGQSVTFTATVAWVAPGAGTPTGTVTFMDGTTPLGSGTLTTTNAVTKATFTSNSLALGPHTVTASYGGDLNFLNSLKTAPQYVDTNVSSYLSNGVYNLGNVSLPGAYFLDLSLAGANLGNSNLTGTHFNLATLTNANLSTSNFSNANFTGANLTGANLTNANLRGATGLSTATLTNVQWSKTGCPDGTLSNSDGGTCLGHL
jgi:hypothetical protein